MILACPACDTRFQLEAEALLPDGRWLRCGKCGNEWHQEPEIAAPQEAPPPSPLSGAPPAEEFPPKRAAPMRGAATARAQARGSRLWLGWVALFVFVAIVGGGFVLGREAILAAVPKMERLYDLVGLNIPGEGLTLEKVTSDRRLVSGDRVLIIKGLVVNISEKTRKLPKLRASVTDAKGQELIFWLFSPSGEDLQPGESAPFETSTSNPPEDSAQVSITFEAAE